MTLRNCELVSVIKSHTIIKCYECALEEENWLQVLPKPPLLFQTYPTIHVNLSLKCVYQRVDKTHPNIVESSGLCQVTFLGWV